MHRGLRHARQAKREPTNGRSGSRRALLAACIGNVVAWYDFAIYGAFATVIASTYFPRADRTTGLLATLAIFATALTHFSRGLKVTATADA